MPSTQTSYHILWALGPDRPGLVSKITEVLFNLGCNLEDSSMMRLGSEFGILLIFTSPSRLSLNKIDTHFSAIRNKSKLLIGIKKISKRLAQFKIVARQSLLIRIHGPDKRGIVYQITKKLSKIKFNITDLETHKTKSHDGAGFILLIEGEKPNHVKDDQIIRMIHPICKKLKLSFSITPIQTNIL